MFTNNLGVNKLLIVGDDEKLVGLITSKDVVLRRTLKNATVDKNFQLVCGAAIGILTFIININIKEYP
jgi:hypothetical protein